MIIDIKDTKVYLISPGIEKYKLRVSIVFDRLITSGFKQIIFFRSLPGINGTDSLSRTVLEIFKTELKSGFHQPFLILEDDVNIELEYGCIEIPDDADAVYLGVSDWIYPYPFNTLGCGYHIRKNTADDLIDISPQLTRIKGMTSAHAILFLNEKFIEKFLNLMTERLAHITPHDLVFATMHSMYNIYALKNPMFYQDKSLGGQENVTNLRFNGKNYS